MRLDPFWIQQFSEKRDRETSIYLGTVIIYTEKYMKYHIYENTAKKYGTPVLNVC